MGVHPAIDLTAIEDGTYLLVNDLWWRGAVGIEEITALIGFIFPFNVTVAQWQFQ